MASDSYVDIVQRMVNERDERIRILFAENSDLRKELFSAKVDRRRDRSRSPMTREIIADNTPDRKAQALETVCKNMVFRSQIETAMKKEIDLLTVEVKRLKIVDEAQCAEIDDLMHGHGRIADVFFHKYTEDAADIEAYHLIPAAGHLADERGRLDRQWGGTTVEDFLNDLRGARAGDLTTHIDGHRSTMRD